MTLTDKARKQAVHWKVSHKERHKITVMCQTLIKRILILLAHLHFFFLRLHSLQTLLSFITTIQSKKTLEP